MGKWNGKRSVSSVNRLKELVSVAEFEEAIVMYKGFGTPNDAERKQRLETYAEMCEVNYETFKRQIREYLKIEPHVYDSPDTYDYSKDILKIESDNIAYASCIHAPNYVSSKIKTFVKDLKSRGIHDTGLIGDFGDWEWFDQHAKLMTQRSSMAIRDFKAIALDLLYTICDATTGKIYILTGNHETKVLRRNEALFSWIDLLSDTSIKDRVVMSEYPKMFVYSPSAPDPIKWTYAIHFSQYSQNPITLGNGALKGLQIPNEDSLYKYITPNLVGGHTHGGWQGIGENGISKVMILGTFADPKKSSYIWTTTRGYPQWNTSYSTFQNGKWDYATI